MAEPAWILRRSVLAAVAVVAVAAAAAGCATTPSASAPRAVKTGGSQIQAYVQPLPPPGPKPGWKAREVVLGFLHASASYAFDPAAARQYLIPGLRRTWSPGPVTVVSSLGSSTTLPYHSQLTQSGALQQLETVDFTGQRLATLSQTGQYQYSPGPSSYRFILQLVKGVWLIATLPQGGHSLLLTQSDFEKVFQPRNLFFWAPPEPSAVNGQLVPDPVYAPLQSTDSALNTNLATGLVNGLLNDQGSWLSGATWTAFPHGTKLLGITISGQTAIVNLGGAAASASTGARQNMEAQLRATLGSKAYSPALADNVQLEINGRAVYPGNKSNLIYEVRGGSLSYQTGPTSVAQTSAAATSRLAAAQLGTAAITAIAVLPQITGRSLDPVAVAAKGGSGCAVYLPVPVDGGQSAPYRGFPLATSGGPCTSLSWDSNGNLWAVAGGRIWVLRAQNRLPLAVSIPPNLALGGHGPRILALRMGPDGVRAALLIHSAGGNRLVLAAVSIHGNSASLGDAVVVGTGLAGPVALAWYNPFNLVVLARSEIWLVPLTGGAGVLLGGAPAGAVALTTDGSTLAVGTDRDQIRTSSAVAISWSVRSVTGTIPAYPG